jgi:colanic acid/amylovoran biosynthesis glycosyltransferase
MPDGDSGQAREIAVFRHNLFRISEPFITQQAGQLRRYKPLYVGRLRYGDAPAGADSLTLRDLGGSWPMVRIGWQMLTRDPAPYQRLLAGRRPALIHAHFGIEGVYALPLAERLGIPLVTTFHGFDATLSTAALLTSPAWANYPLFRGRLARQGDLFLAASGFIRERLLAMGFPAARTHVHYIGVDCQAIQPRDPAEETPTILHVARLVEVKGAQYLIRAFARLAGRFPAVELAIVGDGPLKSSLQSLAKSLGLEHRVRFLGALPHAQVIDWMRKAAMLVLPSIRTLTGRVEGLGMVLAEAAATGVPAVGSRIGGIPEGIADGETGFLVPEKDPEALARRMAELLDDPALRLRMGVRARTFALERFDIRRQTGKLEAFYDGLLRAAP